MYEEHGRFIAEFQVETLVEKNYMVGNEFAG